MLHVIAHVNKTISLNNGPTLQRGGCIREAVCTIQYILKYLDVLCSVAMKTNTVAIEISKKHPSLILVTVTA